MSVALVVCVLSGFLALAKGFETALRGAGSPAVAVILGGVSNQEMASDVPAGVLRIFSAMTEDPGLARDGSGALVHSREIVLPVDVKPAGDGPARAVALRGMDAAGPALRDSVHLTSGRFVAAGASEIVVSERLARQYGLVLGDRVRLGPIDWTVVGTFTAHGSALESEFWADFETVRANFDRQGQIQSLRFRLASPAALARLRDKAAAIPGATLTVVTEAELYAAQSGRVDALITLFAWPIALLLAVGATAGALNTLMSSVSDRAAEIAT
ncbi:MAG: ABC transporter permease, partial [Bosea sp. (in: a-proteobacteria)]